MAINSSNSTHSSLLDLLRGGDIMVGGENKGNNLYGIGGSKALSFGEWDSGPNSGPILGIELLLMLMMMQNPNLNMVMKVILGVM